MLSGQLMGNKFIADLAKQGIRIFTKIPLAPLRAASMGTKQSIAQGLFGKDATRRDFDSMTKGNLDIKGQRALG